MRSSRLFDSTQAACLLAIALGAFWPSASFGSADSCKLTSGQKVRAVKSFKALSPIFQDPRCVNCHGAVNPFTVDGGHPEYVNIVEEAKKFLKQADPTSDLIESKGPRQASELQGIREIARSQVEISDIDVIRLKAQRPMHKKCLECHVDTWDIPLKHNHFVGRGWKQICMHLKTSSLTNTPTSFLQHMQDDTQVLLGFRGQRGLHKDTPRAVPPAMPFDIVAKHANDWIEAMGREMPPPAGCGCEVDGLALEIRHRIYTNPESGSSKGGFAQFDGTVVFNVLLEEIAPGWYRAEDVLVRRALEVKHVRPAFIPCAGAGWRDERWRVSARLDEERKTMEVRFGYFDEGEQASWTCSRPGYSTTSDLYVDINGLMKSLTMPTAEGTVAHASARSPAGQGDTRLVKQFESISVWLIDMSPPKK
jgi:hypothetical protein